MTPEEIGVGPPPARYTWIPFRCSEGFADNFYHDAWYAGQPTALYRGRAYRPYPPPARHERMELMAIGESSTLTEQLPASGTAVWVGLKPARPLSAAGMRTEPPVSEPSAASSRLCTK